MPGSGCRSTPNAAFVGAARIGQCQCSIVEDRGDLVRVVKLSCVLHPGHSRCVGFYTPCACGKSIVPSTWIRSISDARLWCHHRMRWGRYVCILLAATRYSISIRCRANSGQICYPREEAIKCKIARRIRHGDSGSCHGALCIGVRPCEDGEGAIGLDSRVEYRRRLCLVLDQVYRDNNSAYCRREVLLTPAVRLCPHERPNCY